MDDDRPQDSSPGGENVRRTGEAAQQRSARDASVEAAQLGDLYFGTGNYREALECYRRAVEDVAPMGDGAAEAAALQEDRARLSLKMAKCHSNLRCHEEARALCEAVLDLPVRDTAPALWAEARLRLGEVEFRRGCYDAVVTAASSAYDVLAAMPDSTLLAQSTELLGLAHAELGDIEAARRLLTDSLVSWRGLRDDRRIVGAHTNLGILAMRTGDLHLALEHLGKAVETARMASPPDSVAARLSSRANVLLRLGRWDDALADLDGARALYTALGLESRIVSLEPAFASIARVRGDWPKALELLDRTLAKAREQDNPRAEAVTLRMRGELEAERGQHGPAIEFLDQSLEIGRRISQTGDVVLDAIRLRAEALVERGDLAAAERDCLASLELSRRLGDRMDEGMILRTQGRVRYGQRDAAGGHDLLCQAEALLRTVGAVFEMAKCGLFEAIGLLGLGCADAGSVDSADARAASALAIFADLGAEHWAARAELVRARALLVRREFDGSLACLERARRRFEVHADDRWLAQVDDLVREVQVQSARDTASSAGRYAAIAHACALARARATTTADLHDLVGEVADAVSADRLLLASIAADRVTVAASADRAGQGMAGAFAFLRQAVRDLGCDHPIIIADGPSAPDLPTGAGAVAVVPGRGSDAGDASYVLYADRAGAADSVAFRQVDIEYLATVVPLLAAVHARLVSAPLGPDGGESDDAELQVRFPGLITRNPLMLELLSEIEHLRESRVEVLIRGESGTGKEVVARAIHYGGRSRTGEFVALNAGAISPHLQESELFGHVKGAFTDAHKDTEGIVAAAARGTLFLDEIGDMRRDLQVKFLRFLQDGEYRRIGETVTRRSDARVISATNKDLDAEVRAGRFRQDLLHRLNTFSMEVPPLRDRLEDIEPLMDHFLAVYCDKERKRLAGFTREVRQLFLRYDWRENNVRELENEVRRAVAVCDDGDAIGLDKISSELRDRAALLLHHGRGPSLKDELEVIERRRILDALSRCGWNRKRAADLLGISRTGLLTKMRKYCIG